MKWLSLVCLCLLGVTACAPVADSAPELAPQVELGAQALEARQTEAAAQVQAQRAAQEANAAEVRLTAVAQSTRGALQLEQTRVALYGTATAIRSAAEGTAVAQQSARTATLAAASATSEVLRTQAEATETALAYSGTATAAAYAATAQSQRFQVAQAAQLATATMQAGLREQARAESDARRAEQWQEFQDSFTRFLMVIASFALTLIGLITVWRWSDTVVVKRQLVETRSGTLFISRSGAVALVGETVSRYPQLGPGPGDAFDASEVPSLSSETDLLKVVRGGQVDYIPARSEEDEIAERNRKLALKLLRANMQQLGGAGKRLLGFRDLGWSSETWVKAVDLLRPWLVVSRGRGGGTWCGVEYPTLATLYCAVGERRLRLVPPPAGEVSAQAQNVS